MALEPTLYERDCQVGYVNSDPMTMKFLRYRNRRATTTKGGRTGAHRPKTLVRWELAWSAES